MRGDYVEMWKCVKFPQKKIELATFKMLWNNHAFNTENLSTKSLDHYIYKYYKIYSHKP